MTTVERIHVTENEREIFDLLLRAVRNFSPETELRVAGGWVRDKLLGQDSSDTDIAISDMLPSDFDEVQGHVIQSLDCNVIGARFGFTMDEQLKEAASSEEVRVAIAGKISRERIGKEIDLMISGNRPVTAVNLLSDLKLLGLVFAQPLPSLDGSYVEPHSDTWAREWTNVSGGATDFFEHLESICLIIAGTIREMCLDTIWDVKPLVDGSDIIKAL